MSAERKIVSVKPATKYNLVVPEVERFAIMLVLPLHLKKNIRFSPDETIYGALEKITEALNNSAKDLQQKSELVSARMTLNFADIRGTRMENIAHKGKKLKIALSFNCIEALVSFQSRLKKALVEGLETIMPVALTSL